MKIICGKNPNQSFKSLNDAREDITGMMDIAKMDIIIAIRPDDTVKAVAQVYVDEIDIEVESISKIATQEYTKAWENQELRKAVDDLRGAINRMGLKIDE